ncbi:glutamine amidotransferase [Alloalcanivorax sp. C16-2]|uniref:glutamine amidotransferase n=1 Tax=Alloalcanivorax TaxID=3020832 RepID=UPI0019344CF8|nr:glutamine amidotransferase [Alloalcanivorax marinus]MBL7251122.1 glutamine amidotransferase [Alloalcanivorax marinus]
MKPVLILKTGSTYPILRQHYGDFEDWIGRGLGERTPVRVVNALDGDTLPHPAEAAGVVISGSHAMVTDEAPWMRRLMRWLEDALGQAEAPPMLGICFGHQLLARTLGGEVDDHPLGMEVGTVALRLSTRARGDALLGGLWDQPWAQMMHRQSVLVAPPGVEVLASNGHDSCQAFRYGSRVWGCQFHPEFSADVTRAYLQAQRGRALSDQQVDDALPKVRECHQASSILMHFAERAVPAAA